MASRDTPTAVEQLLQYELQAFAGTLGLASPPEPLSPKTVVEALNFAEHLSRQSNPDDHRICLLICALAWEHRRPDWAAIPSFLTELLLRIGLGPTAMMLQEEELTAPQRFPAVGSLRSEVELAARLLANEVVPASGAPIDLTAFQAKVWRAISQFDRLGISAPTSAGKSFVLTQRIGDLLARSSGEILYVVPTLSLISQVTRDLRAVLKAIGNEDAIVTQTFSPKYRGAADSVVYVLTQERAQAALAQSPDVFRDLLLFVVDEVQNVERVAKEDHDRSRILYDVITTVVDERTPQAVVLSGPRIDDIGHFSQDLFGETAVGITDELPPVVNVTYSFSRRRGGTTITQHADLCRSSQTVSLNGKTLKLKRTFGKKQWRDDIFRFLGEILPPLRADGGVLIFSPTGAQATKTAIALGTILKQPPGSSGLRGSLAEYAAETVHPRYGLTDCLPTGVGYHHGRMPHHLRMSVEHAFAVEAVDVVACTTTLMQGVNLPAKTLIARNPNLFTKGRSGEGPAVLSGYEFGNLRGRAGRLMEDFVGRTIVLDEDEFEKQELPLFEFPAKTLKHGYESRFRLHEAALLEDLRRQNAPEKEKRYNDLLMYVRQTALRHGEKAKARLERTGVRVQESELSAVRDQLDALSAPRDFLLKFPYWDPFDLDRLWVTIQTSDVPAVPASPFAFDFVPAIQRIMDVVEQVVPYYRDRYLGTLHGNALWSIVRSAADWGRGEPLRSLVDWGDAGSLEDPVEIDRRVDRVQNTAGFALPRLLAPVVMAQDEDNPILTFLEMGTADPVARRLVELGVPRETALTVAGRLAPRSVLDHEGTVQDGRLQSEVRRLEASLNYWQRVQVTGLVPLPTGA